jgi:hypothetical protein
MGMKQGWSIRRRKQREQQWRKPAPGSTSAPRSAQLRLVSPLIKFCDGAMPRAKVARKQSRKWAEIWCKNLKYSHTWLFVSAKRQLLDLQSDSCIASSLGQTVRFISDFLEPSSGTSTSTRVGSISIQKSRVESNQPLFQELSESEMISSHNTTNSGTGTTSSSTSTR